MIMEDQSVVYNNRKAFPAGTNVPELMEQVMLKRYVQRIDIYS